MTVSLKEKKENLVNNILLATSQDEVSKLIKAVVLNLQQLDHTDEMLNTFVEKLSVDLNSFNPHKQTAQQWSNIKMARIVINRLKYHYNTLTY